MTCKRALFSTKQKRRRRRGGGGGGGGLHVELGLGSCWKGTPEEKEPTTEPCRRRRSERKTRKQACIAGAHHSPPLPPPPPITSPLCSRTERALQVRHLHGCTERLSKCLRSSGCVNFSNMIPAGLHTCVCVCVCGSRISFIVTFLPVSAILPLFSTSLSLGLERMRRVTAKRKGGA